MRTSQPIMRTRLPRWTRRYGSASGATRWSRLPSEPAVGGCAVPGGAGCCGARGVQRGAGGGRDAPRERCRSPGVSRHGRYVCPVRLGRRSAPLGRAGARLPGHRDGPRGACAARTFCSESAGCATEGASSSKPSGICWSGAPAQKHALPELAGAQFELANARAERGDLRGAVALYAETAETGARSPRPQPRGPGAQQPRLSPDAARRDGRGGGAHRAAFHLSDAFGLTMACEYLYSTRGEIVIAEGRWDEAEEWINPSLAESQPRNNVAHVAKCRANLARIAQGRGDLDAALLSWRRPRRSPRP